MAKNLLDVYQRNPTFDPSWGAGMQQLPEGNIFVPDGWNLGWRADAPFEGIHNEPPGLVAHRPEATIINEWQGLEPELTPDASYAWKIFVQNPLYAWIMLNLPIALPAGNYKFQVKVWPKLHLLAIRIRPTHGLRKSGYNLQTAARLTGCMISTMRPTTCSNGASCMLAGRSISSCTSKASTRLTTLSSSIGCAWKRLRAHQSQGRAAMMASWSSGR